MYNEFKEDKNMDENKLNDEMLEKIAGGHVTMNADVVKVETIDGGMIHLYNGPYNKDVAMEAPNGTKLQVNMKVYVANYGRILGYEDVEYYYARYKGTWMVLKKAEILPFKTK